MADKKALLQVWDPGLGRVVDIEIVWDKGFDRDARAKIPVQYQARWKLASTFVRKDTKSADGFIAPYPTLPSSVPVDRLASSCTGIFAVAQEIFGEQGTGWRVPPPYPESKQTIPLGVEI